MKRFYTFVAAIFAAVLVALPARAADSVKFISPHQSQGTCLVTIVPANTTKLLGYSNQFTALGTGTSNFIPVTVEYYANNTFSTGIGSYTTLFSDDITAGGDWPPNVANFANAPYHTITLGSNFMESNSETRVNESWDAGGLTSGDTVTFGMAITNTDTVNSLTMLSCSGLGAPMFYR